jgi:hypothetical protein
VRDLELTCAQAEETANAGPATGEVLPLTETTNQTAATTEKPARQPREPRQPRERGPPADGIPSKNKVMVANLPYDLSEEKVSLSHVPLGPPSQANGVLQ